MASIQHIKLTTIFQACSGGTAACSGPQRSQSGVSMPSSGIPLNTLPFLNNNRDTHSDVIFTDQPAIGRHTPIGDHDVEAGEDDEEQANGHEDEEAEHLNHQRHQHHRCRTRPSPITTIKSVWHLQLYNLLERPKSSLLNKG